MRLLEALATQRGERAYSRRMLARRMHVKVSMKNADPTSAPRFVLVIGLDASPEADSVLEAASVFARAIEGAELHLVHAIETYDTEGFPVAEAHERAMTRARSYLDEKARSAQARSGVAVVGHLRESAPASAILQAAASTDADLVVVGTHDPKGLSRWLMGSVAERVAREASCPVLVVRPKHHAVARAPEIEPPCVDCLRAQRETKGVSLWCARHSEHHPVAHLHYEVPQGFGEGSSLIRA